jgi:hypothetical protein
LPVIVIPASATASLAYQGPAILEIEVTENGYNDTWYPEVEISKGNINT